MLISCAVCPVHEEPELPGLIRLVDVLHLVPPDQRIQGRSGFHRQGVTGKMRHPETDGLFHILLPVDVGQRRTAIDEIDRKIETFPLGHPDTFQGLPRIMRPVHPPKVFFEKRLHADAEPVHASGSPGSQPFRSNIIGIGFQGDLCIRRHRKKSDQPAYDRPELIRLQQGRRAAAKINRCHRLARDIILS